MAPDMVAMGMSDDHAIASAAGIDEDAGPDQMDSIVEIEHRRSISETHPGARSTPRPPRPRGEHDPQCASKCLADLAIAVGGSGSRMVQGLYRSVLRTETDETT
jgi:hypothetical protein